MELDHLREYIELTKILNFTEAAERLHLAQPTLSKHMIALENEFGARLFDRSGVQITLTEEGFYLLGIARSVVDILEEAHRTVSTMQAREPIYVDGRFEDPVISQLVSYVSEMSEKHNLAPVRFNHVQTKPPLELLREGKIDVIVDMATEASKCDEALEVIPLFSQPIVLVIERTNPLAKKTSLSVTDLEDATFCRLLWDYFDPGWNTIETLCRRAGFEPRQRPVPVRSMAEALALPLQGSIMPFTSADNAPFADASNKIQVPLTDEDAVFTTCLIFRKDNREKLASLIDIALDACAHLSSRL